MSDAMSQTSVGAHVVAPAAQASAVSSQVSTPSQAMPSSHERAVAPAQTPPVQTSPTVQNWPSSQVPPSFELQSVADTDTAQRRHGSLGLICPSP